MYSNYVMQYLIWRQSSVKREGKWNYSFWRLFKFFGAYIRHIRGNFKAISFLLTFELHKRVKKKSIHWFSFFFNQACLCIRNSLHCFTDHVLFGLSENVLLPNLGTQLGYLFSSHLLKLQTDRFVLRKNISDVLLISIPS